METATRPVTRGQQGVASPPSRARATNSRGQHRGQQQGRPTLAGETPPTPPTLPVEKRHTPRQDLRRIAPTIHGLPSLAVESHEPPGTSVGSVSKKEGRHSI
ncbi:hypothetical protein NDU88_008181 [Pleurodeles waltl]|uniref:Uncharacterized protein n=1 Tax=Pleurodeles waltl TaxID=8319 RepID=A0AAV7VSX1_PLEWA|nr:hypothetical protein NDU88_008181 [Pleurodeles waltl]